MPYQLEKLHVVDIPTTLLDLQRCICDLVLEQRRVAAAASWKSGESSSDEEAPASVPRVLARLGGSHVVGSGGGEHPR